MSLKSIFELALTTDKRYNTGDISEKTGLQKQPDGSWKPPKGSNAGKQEADLRKAAMNGGTKEKKALFKFEAKNADDEQLKHVLSSKNQPAERIEIYKAELEKRNGKSTLSPEKKEKRTPSTKWKHDYKSYLPKKNEQLREMYLKEKDPKTKQAIKKALQEQSKMLPSDSACLTGDTKIVVKK